MKVYSLADIHQIVKSKFDALDEYLLSTHPRVWSTDIVNISLHSLEVSFSFSLPSLFFSVLCSLTNPTMGSLVHWLYLIFLLIYLLSMLNTCFKFLPKRFYNPELGRIHDASRAFGERNYMEELREVLAILACIGILSLPYYLAAISIRQNLSFIDQERLSGDTLSLSKYQSELQKNSKLTLSDERENIVRTYVGSNYLRFQDSTRVIASQLIILATRLTFILYRCVEVIFFGLICGALCAYACWNKSPTLIASIGVFTLVIYAGIIVFGSLSIFQIVPRIIYLLILIVIFVINHRFMLKAKFPNRSALYYYFAVFQIGLEPLIIIAAELVLLNLIDPSANFSIQILESCLICALFLPYLRHQTMKHYSVEGIYGF